MAKKTDDAPLDVADERGDPHAIITLATSVVRAYVERNQIPIAEVPSFIQTIHGTLRALANGDAGIATSANGEPLKPAVPIKRSVQDDHIVCLEDGVKLKMLKRYLKSHYNLSPEEYRRKWGLPLDYPMVAPAYARLRSAFAKKIGLGHVPGGGRPKRK